MNDVKGFGSRGSQSHYWVAKMSIINKWNHRTISEIKLKRTDTIKASETSTETLGDSFTHPENLPLDLEGVAPEVSGFLLAIIKPAMNVESREVNKSLSKR